MSIGAGIYGLAAAVAWGFSDVSAAIVTRRIGSRTTTGIIVPISCVLLVALFVIAGGTPPQDLGALAGSIVLGTGGACIYFLAYAAFRAGPVTIVGPLLSGAGGLTVILSIVFLGERPSAFSLVAALVGSIGVVLAGIVLGGAARFRASGPGIPFALGALVIAGALPIVVSLVVRDEHWLTALTFARITNAAVVISALIVLRFFRARRRASADVPPAPAPVPRFSRQTVALLLAISALEVVAVSSFFAGVAVGPTWLVGLTSSFGPLVVVAGGLLLFHERPRPVQWAGVTMVLVSALALAVRV
jgi:drug/metabolite transporter (DMT)-like permease